MAQHTTISSPEPERPLNSHLKATLGCEEDTIRILGQILHRIRGPIEAKPAVQGDQPANYPPHALGLAELAHDLGNVLRQLADDIAALV